MKIFGVSLFMVVTLLVIGMAFQIAFPTNPVATLAGKVV